MPWFPDPNGGPPIQAPTNPNPAGGTYGLYSDPSYNGPPPGSGTVTGTSTGSTSSSSAAPSIGTSANLAAFSTAVNAATAAAQQAYYQGLLQLQREDLAFQKAKEAFAETISRAGLSGIFEGQGTLAAFKQASDLAAQQAGLTGVYNAPSPYAEGSFVKTQDISGAPGWSIGKISGGRLVPMTTPNDFANAGGTADMVANMPIITRDQFLGYANGTMSLAGAPTTTLAAQNQYFNQAYLQQQANQKATQDYLTLLSNLRGPQDYGQYLRTLASTPQGLTSLASAAAGNGGRVPYFGTTGAQTQGATVGGLIGQPGVGTQAGAAAAAGGGTSYDEYMRAAQSLPPPSQIAPQNWNAMNDTQKKLLLSMYESNGWNVTDAMQQYQASLPKFGGATGSVNLV